MGRIQAFLKTHIGSLFVIAAVAGGSFLFMALQPQQPDLPRYEGIAKQDPTYRPGGSQCDPVQLRRLPATTETLRERDDCQTEVEQHRLAQADLEQQVRSANAAEAVVWLAYNQSLVLLVGTILGCFTLIAAIAAAKFARDAALQARDGVAATRVHVQAHVTIDGQGIVRGDRQLYWLSIVLKNAGQTPARKVTARFGLATPRQDEPLSGEFLGEPKTVEITEIAAGQPAQISTPIEQDHHDAARQGEQTIYFRVTLDYVDVFGTAHTKDYLLSSEPHQLPMGVVGIVSSAD